MYRPTYALMLLRLSPLAPSINTAGFANISDALGHDFFTPIFRCFASHANLILALDFKLNTIKGLKKELSQFSTNNDEETEDTELLQSKIIKLQTLIQEAIADAKKQRNEFYIEVKKTLKKTIDAQNQLSQQLVSAYPKLSSAHAKQIIDLAQQLNCKPVNDQLRDRGISVDSPTTQWDNLHQLANALSEDIFGSTTPSNHDTEYPTAEQRQYNEMISAQSYTMVTEDQKQLLSSLDNQMGPLMEEVESIISAHRGFIPSG
jgi:hypothetical protein